MDIGRRERKKRATRHSLEEAAMKLFTERGYDGTTVDDIADVADVSARTFFRYFATKDDVLFGDHEPRLTAMRELLDGRPAGEPLMDSLRALLAMLGDILVENLSRVLVQAEVAAQKVQVHGLFLQHQKEMADEIARFVEARIDPGPDAPIRARVLASATIGAYLAAAAAWVASEGTDDLQAQLTAALDAMGRVVVLDAA